MKRESKIAKEKYLKKLELIRASSKANPYETKEEQRAAIQRAKSDYGYMITRYFPHYATSETADFQLKFANKVKKDRLIKAFAQWGRGLAKSVHCDVTLPFHLWINDEAHYVVLIGQTYDKAKQLLGDLQAEFEANPQIIADFGEQKLEGSWEDGKFQTKGCREWNLRPFMGRALGMGQEVRGLRIGSQRPDLIIVDDVETRELIKNPKRQDEYVNWIETALIPTMDGPIRRLLYANNRFAVRMIQTELQKKHPGWWVHHVPAYDRVTWLPTWHQKYPPDYYKILSSDEEIGIIALQQEYLQEPVIEGKIFKPEDIIWDELPRLDRLKIVVGHWDIAYAGTPTSDYNAVKVWGLSKDNTFWYVQGFVKQCKMREAVAYICEMERTKPKTVIIHWRFESQFWNDEVQRTIREVSKEMGVQLNILKVDTPRTKKYDRILRMQPKYQNNRIRYNEKMYADNDTQTGLAQLYGIEPGYSGHDDSPDADEQAISELEKYVSYDDGAASRFQFGKMKPKHERI